MEGSIRFNVTPVDHDPFEGKTPPTKDVPLLTEADKRAGIWDTDRPQEPIPDSAVSQLLGFADSEDWKRLQEYSDSLPKTDQTVAEGDLLPISRDDKGNVHFDSDAGVLGSLKRSVMLPGDVATGKVDPRSDEGIARATEMASTLGMGGSVVPKPEGSVGIFGGALAEHPPLDKLNEAIVAQATGKNKYESWADHGWYKDVDGKWKFEIPDDKADFHSWLPLGKESAPGHSYLLSDVFDHPDLYQQYPQLADMHLRFENMGERNHGLFEPAKNIITINPTLPADQQRSTLLHELQHAVQLHEDFGYGGSPAPIPQHIQDLVDQTLPRWNELTEKIQRYDRTRQQFPSLSHDELAPLAPTSQELDTYQRLRTVYQQLDDARRANYDAYHRMSGEVEARNVQSRAGFDPEQAREVYPDFTADVDPQDRTVEFPYGAPRSAGSIAPHSDWHPNAIQHLMEERNWFRNAEGPESNNTKALDAIISQGPKADRFALGDDAWGHLHDALGVHIGASGPQALEPSVHPLLRRLHETAEDAGGGVRYAPDPPDIQTTSRQDALLKHAGYNRVEGPDGEEGWHFPTTHPEPPKPPQASDYIGSSLQRANHNAQREGMTTTPESRLQSVMDALPGQEPGLLHGIVTGHLARADMNLPEFQSAMSGGMTRPGSFKMMPTGEPGQIEYHMGLHAEDGTPVGHTLRIISKDSVDHDLMEINPEQQGTGVAKKVISSQVALWQKMGLNKATLYANIEVGGYAWAKYGMAPSQQGWNMLRQGKLAPRAARVMDQLSPEGQQELQRVLASDDPKSIWQLSDMTEPVQYSRTTKPKPLGKYLLLNAGWHGTLDLNDKPSMERFNAYTGRAPAGRRE